MGWGICSDGFDGGFRCLLGLLGQRVGLHLFPMGLFAGFVSVFVNRLCVCVGSIDLEMESDFFESVWIVAGHGGLWWL